MARLIGDFNAFWDNAAVGAGGNSAVVELGRAASNLVLFVTSSGITTITVQVGHHGDLVGGIESDLAPTVWHNLWYLGEAQVITFTGAGSIAKLIPDMAARFMRLSSSAAMTITAGWSGIRD